MPDPPPNLSTMGRAPRDSVRAERIGAFRGERSRRAPA